ncbi:MAG: serine/threonine-protein kinase, partial [Prochlorothrix sp.]|nr:serine/threonine-protein kinase [Prochlorothrix sp.]
MALSPGSTLQNGKYKLQQTLGKGGFGLTYRAEHTVFQASLVLKSPNDDLRADPEYPKFVARFLKEGKTLWNLSQQRHPHIVRVTDLFEERGVPWLVMDYIRGESLFDRVQRKGALPEAEVVGFIQQMGSALLAVHGAGLVHRDAHPGNIMILPPNPTKAQREAILIDFGIAGEMFPSTFSSKFFGTPAFAPYEQFGMPADPSMDVYTLAASCYLAVTGVLPESAMNRKLYGRGLVPPQDHRRIDRRLNGAILAG